MRSIEWIESRCEKITDTGCWIWMGALKQGYGSFRDKWKEPTKDAHRAAMLAVHGEIPAGIWVLHRCDIRCCCNPAHLFFGDRYANIQDAVTKGRLKGIAMCRPSGLKYVWTKKPGPKGRRNATS